MTYASASSRRIDIDGALAHVDLITSDSIHPEAQALPEQGRALKTEADCRVDVRRAMIYPA